MNWLKTIKTINMEVICCNDTYTNDTLEWYKQMGIQYPIKDKIYTIRNSEKTFNGLGIRLVEIINPVCPIKGFTGIFHKEPSFSSSRFKTLLGESILASEIVENTAIEI